MSKILCNIEMEQKIHAIKIRAHLNFFLFNLAFCVTLKSKNCVALLVLLSGL